MATVESYFEKFVSNLNPDDDAKNNAKVAHNALRDHLFESELYGEYYSDSFLYGSYKRHTAIHDIDDVDVCILVDIDHTSEDGKPMKVLKKLKKAISGYYTDVEWYDDENTAYNRRSILVKDALPNNPNSQLSLDVIPAIQDPDSDFLLVPDKELWEWVQTNPKWHIDFSQKMNDDSDQEFIKIVKIFKHLKKYHIKNKHPKGFWIETLVWVCYKQGDSMAESFYKTLLNILDTYKYKTTSIPDLRDFWMEWETIKTSMELDHFLKFMELLSTIKDEVNDAINSDDQEYSVAIWRHLFGESFFPASLSEINKTTEESIIDYHEEEIDFDYKVTIWCDYKIESTSDFTRNENSRKTSRISLFRKQWLTFSCKSNCPSWTTYLWKVRNFWVQDSQIRWQIGEFTNHDSNSNVEHTEYFWTHIAQCYAIYNWVVIAKDLFRVTIEGS